MARPEHRAARPSLMWRLGAVLAAWALPLAAQAHGLADAESEALLRATGGEWAPFARAGFSHMLTGWDHLLFVAVLLLRSPGRAAAAWAVTAFSLGHSLTLYIGLGAAWTPPLAAVDLAVALTIAALAAPWPARAAPSPFALRLALALAGLVHGLGLAGALHARLEGLQPTLGQHLAFNLGIEAAQLLVLGLLLAVGLLLQRLPLAAAARQPLCAAAAALGLGLAGWQLAAWWQPPLPAVSSAQLPWRSDEWLLQLPPGGVASGDAEISLRMRAGDSLVYHWQAEVADQRFWSDLHGVADGDGRGITYRRGLGATDAGALRAAFDGQHGWYLQNQTLKPVTVRLRVAGFYAPPAAAPGSPAPSP